MNLIESVHHLLNYLHHYHQIHIPNHSVSLLEQIFIVKYVIQVQTNIQTTKLHARLLKYNDDLSQSLKDKFRIIIL